MKLSVHAPINALSLGNVSVNFLRELYRLNVEVGLFPMGNRAEFDAYDQLDPKIRDWIIGSAHNRFNSYDFNVPVLRVWHINGSHERVSRDQYLYTFYECDSPTPQEVNIVKSQKHVFFSSSCAAQLFEAQGCKNVSFVPLGFDEDFDKVSTPTLKDTIHFGLIGKFEQRKNTKKIIRCWTELYGDKPGYQLSLLVSNPFYSDEDFGVLLANALQHKKWANVNVLPRLKTNSEVAMLHKSLDIDLSGISGGEGRNLPAFNSTCLGKWTVVSKCSSHLDWANNENSILIEPDGKEPCYDGKFFMEGAMFNQGKFYHIPEERIKEGMVRAVEKVQSKPNNELGERLRLKYTYNNSIQQILERISE